MPVKRRNHGRGKMHAGRIQYVNCLNCGKVVPKDKAIKRFAIKNMVDPSAAKDVLDADIYPGYELPKLYQKAFYCVSCSCHRRIVRVRNAALRRDRVPLYQKLQQEKLARRAQTNTNQKQAEAGQAQ